MFNPGEIWQLSFWYILLGDLIYFIIEIFDMLLLLSQLKMIVFAHIVNFLIQIFDLSVSALEKILKIRDGSFKLWDKRFVGINRVLHLCIGYFTKLLIFLKLELLSFLFFLPQLYKKFSPLLHILNLRKIFLLFEIIQLII